MRVIPLVDLGLVTVEEAASRRGVNERTIRAWITAGVLPVVVVGTGRRAVYLLRAADVACATAPRRGAPPGRKK